MTVSTVLSVIQRPKHQFIFHVSIRTAEVLIFYFCTQGIEIKVIGGMKLPYITNQTVTELTEYPERMDFHLRQILQMSLPLKSIFFIALMLLHSKLEYREEQLLNQFPLSDPA